MADIEANSAFYPSGVGKWIAASAGKAKAGMVQSVSGWTQGVQVYLNFVSSDNDIKQNNRNNGIADDTGNRRELVHLHGTYT